MPIFIYPSIIQASEAGCKNHLLSVDECLRDPPQNVPYHPA